MKKDSTSRGLRPWQWIFLLLLIVGTGFILRKHNSETVWQESEGKIFGTYYSVKYQHAESLDSTILAALKQVDGSLSMFNPQSTVSQINRNVAVSVDSLFAEVFQLSQQVATQTDGSFDVTVAPLVNAWGFGFEKSDSVVPQHIDSLRQYVGYEKVSLSDGRLHKSHPSTQLDFSAIAKGYGVDCVARVLSEQGAEDFLVNIGGEIVSRGHRSDGQPWRVGIETPDTLSDVSLKAYLELTDAALATSGNYRRFYYKDGVRYAHTIDPHTGYPVNHTLLSATVVAKTCALADAYATAFMVMGLDKSKTFVAQHPEVSAYFIYALPNDSLAVWASEGMQRLLVE